MEKKQKKKKKKKNKNILLWEQKQDGRMNIDSLKMMKK